MVSFDDLPLTGILYPELTAIHQPSYEKGVAATEILVKRIAGEDCKSVRLNATLVKRNSVAQAKS